MAESSEPRSRRDRPAKPPLSRQWIIDVTIDIMRREGLKKATMRRVATELETGPASLYVYIRNTAELHAAVLDEVLGEIQVPHDGPWQEQVEQLVTAYRDVIVRYHGLARSALVQRPSGPTLFTVFDRLIGLFIDGAGISPGQATWGADLLLLVATANAAEHAPHEEGDTDTVMSTDEEFDALFAAVRASTSAKTPYLAAHADALLAGAPEQRWEWTLRAQIAGIIATPQPVTR